MIVRNFDNDKNTKNRKKRKTKILQKWADEIKIKHLNISKKRG